MAFGQSYTANFVEPLLWVKTSFRLKIIRAVVGILLSAAILALCYVPNWIIKDDELATQFTFGHLLPALLISLFVYGCYPVLCLKFGWVAHQA